jgi:phosphoribosylaminoimidazolecarboxamide formyltransferase/IMP cyclohydrolase
MRALVSVYDKAGLDSFGRGLVDLGWELVSTGNTHRALAEAGLDATSVSDLTGSPEMLDGRVKTLHPAVHGGILARRDRADHLAQLEEHGIGPIDMVVGNLYPFERTVQTPGVNDIDAIEQIDIGGPAMIRAAAKNFSGVIVVTDPRDYDAVLTQLKAGSVAESVRRSLAAKAFAHVSAYDSLVSAYLRGDGRNDNWSFPEEISFAGRLAQPLRYGENPHQRAAAYRRLVASRPSAGILDAEQLGVKGLSFNNLVDADTAWQAAWISARPCVAIVKHAIPCGLAAAATVAEAFDAAVAGDPVSAFGGIVAMNVPLDEATATKITGSFFEVVIAPEIEPGARTLLARKPNLRVLRLATAGGVQVHTWDIKPITGGLLVQDADTLPDDESGWTVVTNRPPSVDELRDLRFAWAAARLVKSNAIVLVQGESIVGIGSGQPNRLESVAIATRLAGDRSRGSVLASDAFFPFPDGIEAAGAAGVRAIIQPGGSIRDKQVISAADAAGIAMVFTGTRHFRH